MQNLTTQSGFSEGDALPDHAEAMRDGLIAVCNRFLGSNHPVEAVLWDPDRTRNPLLLRFKRRNSDPDTPEVYVDQPIELTEFLEVLNDGFFSEHVRMTVEIDNAWQPHFDAILSEFRAEQSHTL